MHCAYVHHQTHYAHTDTHACTCLGSGTLTYGPTHGRPTRNEAARQTGVRVLWLQRPAAPRKRGGGAGLHIRSAVRLHN